MSSKTYKLMMFGQVYEVQVSLAGNYDTGMAAIRLVEPDGAPFATLSVNLPDQPNLIDLAKIHTSVETRTVGFIAKLGSENTELKQLLNYPEFVEISRGT